MKCFYCCVATLKREKEEKDIRRTHTLTQRHSFIEPHSSTQNFICKSFSLTHMMLNLFYTFFLDIYLVVSVVELYFVCALSNYDMQYIEEKERKTNEQVKFETNFVALCKERRKKKNIFFYIT